MSLDHLSPTPYVVTGNTRENADTAPLRLAPLDRAVPRFHPGQFAMVRAGSIGEIALATSADPSTVDSTLAHTVRAVDPVSTALRHARPGAVVGVRGPFGTGWDLPVAAQGDVLVVAGGIGLAALRPVVLAALAQRWRYRRLVLVLGAHSPGEFVYRPELAAWSEREDMTVVSTVDITAAGWRGQVGFVTEPLAWLPLEPATTTAFVCGPEPMTRFTAQSLLRRGVPAHRIRVYLDRNIQCGVGQCGLRRLDPLLPCWDGPELDWATAGELLTAAPS
ncbi:FAD/NAD(P)-binding protein [Kutzneria albida]|uniref:Flavodoxin oxidoreductase n=1 Tax=Kutzneria albida DSM 43870 TaxID=1449976 RepID=W5WFP2_9PSEU|nr:FAD/NAD(P)-binding protein [Kutzneria albida]AHH96994.1 flavodoxin oxidoreductase [Kutzneria albida DSM 43870]